ncbi:unnamed protein product [Lactuca virosa]|uniref:Uncharacterized protein n=1 Tax=Lactuca virosa TaxID=75947 RepID=A0AAU9NHL7_9ASTR|nr:unnamed protein product [Lactuca virosa]
MVVGFGSPRLNDDGGNLQQWSGLADGDWDRTSCWRSSGASGGDRSRQGGEVSTDTGDQWNSDVCGPPLHYVLKLSQHGEGRRSTAVDDDDTRSAAELIHGEGGSWEGEV